MTRRRFYLPKTKGRTLGAFNSRYDGISETFFEDVSQTEEEARDIEMREQGLPDSYRLNEE